MSVPLPPVSVAPMHILSYGAGVNSTALAVLILTDDRFADCRRNLHIVFADTGGEHPETYAYLPIFANWLESYGLSLTVVCADETLEDYALKKQMLPMRRFRWCTSQFKIRPIHKFIKSVAAGGPIVQLLGIAADEAHRARENLDPHIQNRFPLIEADLDRDGCIRLIQAVGLPVPRKSGCFFCPFLTKKGFADLKRKHPDLFERAVRIEQNANLNGYGVYLRDKPLEELVAPLLAQGILPFEDDADDEDEDDRCLVCGR